MYYVVSSIIFIIAAIYVFRLKKEKAQSNRPPGQNRQVETLVMRLDRRFQNYHYNRRFCKSDMLYVSIRMAFWLIIPVVLVVLYNHIQMAIFLPENAFAYSSESSGYVLFAVGAFLASIAISNLCICAMQKTRLSNTNSKFEERNLRIQVELRNEFLSGLSLLAGLLLLMISLHSFTYYTDGGIVFQGFFTSEIVLYDQIEYAEARLNEPGDYLEYLVHYGPDNLRTASISGEHTLGLDILKVDVVLKQNNIEVRRVPITQEQLVRMEKLRTEQWNELVIGLCGVSS